MKKILFWAIFAFVLIFEIKAQEIPDFKTADSTINAYFAQNDWKNLALFGEKSISEGLSYYKINYLTGLAFFQMNENFKAEKYLKTALRLNSASEEAKKLLHFAYLRNGENFLAGEVMPAEKKWNNLSLSLRLGQKMSDNAEFDAVNFALMGFSGTYKNRFSLYTEYGFIYQAKTVWGSLSQNQILLNPSFFLGRFGTLSAYAQAAAFSGKIAYSYTSKYENTRQGIGLGGVPVTYDTLVNYRNILSGDLTQNIFSFDVQYLYRHERVKFGANAAILYEILERDASESSSGSGYARVLGRDGRILRDDFLAPQIKTDDDFKAKETHFQFGLGIYYTPPILRDALYIGARGMIFSDAKYFSFIPTPFVSFRASPKWYVIGDYMQKGNHPLALDGALMNNYSTVESRFSLTNRLSLNNKLSVSLTTQYEKQTDFFSKIRYSVFSIFLGLKFKL